MVPNKTTPSLVTSHTLGVLRLPTLLPLATNSEVSIIPSSVIIPKWLTKLRKALCLWLQLYYRGHTSGIAKWKDAQVWKGSKYRAPWNQGSSPSLYIDMLTKQEALISSMSGVFFRGFILWPWAVESLAVLLTPLIPRGWTGSKFQLFDHIVFLVTSPHPVISSLSINSGARAHE